MNEREFEPLDKPLPWMAEYFNNYQLWDVVHGDPNDARDRFSVLEDLSEHDAKLICCAVNSHKALVSACQKAISAMDLATEQGFDRDAQAYFALRDAIALTEKYNLLQ